MSRIKELSIPQNFLESGIEPIEKMASHLGRRKEGRVRVVGEALTSESQTNPKREVSKRETPDEGEKIQIIFQWPIGSMGIKRY